MANYFSLTLDTTAPSSPSIVLDGGATYATQQLIDATISTGDGATVGYQMKIWGSVDGTENVNIQSTEGASSWITFNTTQQVKLSSGDGNKTINLKIRDDVLNESSEVSDSVILDTTVPVVTIIGPDVPKISKVAGANVCSFSFTCDTIFNEYKVKVVSASGASHDTGVQLLETNGSINMSGNVGGYPASTPINCQITGLDLETASAGDSAKTIKVFVKDESNQWSV